MKISIIGAGNIGSTLGKKWAASHEIYFGVRNPSDPKYNQIRESGAVVAVAEAVKNSEVVVLAIPGSAVADFVSEHAHFLAGKTILDTTNNPRSADMNNLAILKEKVPTAHLVRAFSTLGWENFANPEINGVQIDLFFCANPSARTLTESLIVEIGLRPVYVGDIDAAAALDGITRLWFALVWGQGYGRRIAFKLITE
jgi:8-hydroxy-5-deazaflavin:NADPH oxidoreductase